MFGGLGGVGANRCSANRCSGEATATLMAVVMANVWRIFADLFGGVSAFRHRQVLSEGVRECCAVAYGEVCGAF